MSKRKLTIEQLSELIDVIVLGSLEKTLRTTRKSRARSYEELWKRVRDNLHLPGLTVKAVQEIFMNARKRLEQAQVMLEDKIIESAKSVDPKRTEEILAKRQVETSRRRVTR